MSPHFRDMEQIGLVYRCAVCFYVKYFSETELSNCSALLDPRGARSPAEIIGHVFWTAGQCDPSVTRDPDVPGSRFVWYLSPTKKAKMTYRNWDKRQPSGGCDVLERCMALQAYNDYKWDDLTCYWEMCFVCEIDL